MGPERFEESLLKRKYEAAGLALQATVLSMNEHVMEVKASVCSPTTKEDDVGYLMRIVPLGEFSDDHKTFLRYKLSTHYIAPQSMHVANVSTLQEVVDFDRSCVTTASILLCKTRPQLFDCGLDRSRRRRCACGRFQFTLVESLLKTTVVATRIKCILYKSVDRDTFESIRRGNDNITYHVEQFFARPKNWVTGDEEKAGTKGR
ncbi:unnamed protein product [Strongylus vulgaris]|uniref:Uncharacterized protein n=1 Tax=Strongylus vulgaris TaxID=40348 RepID=A0A3P7L877_STRVU|nr:unnamed protein product [Strongylus vulgaris]